MATITLKGNSIHTIGNLPSTGSMAPDFTLTATDLSEKTLADFKGSKIVLNIFPSLDTPTCAASVRKFNELATELGDTKVLAISKDLPFAHARFCSSEGIENVIDLSGYKCSGTFGKDYGVEILDGPLAELYSRAVVVIDEEGKVIYTQQVPEIVDEPNYEEVLNVLK
jgi:thiol peroxidase